MAVDERELVRREVEIEAAPEQVWDALVDEERREAWLEPDPERELRIETAAAPEWLVWWWWHGDEPPHRVEVVLLPVPCGTRVIVTESAPAVFPLARMAGAFALALAPA